MYLFFIALFLGFTALAASPARSVRLEPDNIVLAGPSARQHFLLTAVDSQGDEFDVTSSCRVRSADPAVATVEAGEIVGLRPGVASLSVRCGAAAATASVEVRQAAPGMTVDFPRDVLSILTTKGCNGSSCHGSPAGQAGFKLSLYGSDPEADREMIVEKHNGRRVDLANPEQSLLLRKPALALAHGGGQLMTPQSDEYRTLVEWLKQGAPAGSSGVRLVKLDLYPRERILVGAGDRQPLVAIGRLSDGATRDMSAQVRFSVADEGVVSGVQDGAVTAKGRGLTVVTARALGQTATSQMLVIEARADATFPERKPANFIDAHVFDKLRRVNIQPFPPTSDRAFVRRVYLDAIGVLPTPEETDSFVRDPDPARRAKLIDRLLERDDYASHWLMKFEDWFRNSQYYSQGRTNGSYKRWLRDLIRHDRPYDEAVREMLTATGDTTVRPAGNFWHPAIDFMLRTFEVSKATPTVTRLFLGKRLECAECHNHPLENLTQDDFYGIAAFLGRMKVKHGYGQYRRIWYATREGEVQHPVTRQPVQPRFLDGTIPAIGENQDRREVLADWITRAEKLQFARATVNRVWAEYFGAGIVEPYDDFRSTNMPTHPQLLDRLAEHFIENGFRFKALHRLILNSRTYQLSAHTEGRPGGVDPLERLLLAGYRPRKLPAEVLADAVTQVTGVPFEFPNYPAGTSPKDLIAAVGTPYFLEVFGFPQRDVLEARPGSPSLSQALHLMNSDAVRGKVERPDNVLGELLAGETDDRRVAEALYLRAYARPPTEPQWTAIEKYLASEREAGRSRRRAFENVLWAILNSKEFQLNR